MSSGAKLITARGHVLVQASRRNRPPTAKRPRAPPWAKGGAPDPLPSKDGSPQQHNRQAQGQKANKILIMQYAKPMATRRKRKEKNHLPKKAKLLTDGYGRLNLVPATGGTSRIQGPDRSLQNCSHVLRLECARNALGNSE